MAFNSIVPVLFGAALFLAPLAHAQAPSAQAPVCTTANGQCGISGLQPQGTQCHCPDAPGVMGMVGVTTAAPPVYPSYKPHQREELRNDDIDDDGDVLAGPRRHHRSADSDDDDQN